MKWVSSLMVMSESIMIGRVRCVRVLKKLIVFLLRR